MDRREIMAVLAGAGQRPQHKFGQNFMVDQTVLRAIADAGEVGPQDVVLEVGPGVGNLTRLLAQRAAAVLAVDIDTQLMPAAKHHLREHTNITWINADVLAGKHEVNPAVIEVLRTLHAAHPGGAVKLVSNLPYNAASPLIAELLVLMWRDVARGSAPLLFNRLVFTVQYEVAQRMAAGPDTRDYGPLGILIQLLAKVEILRKIPPGCFWPPPKINSGLVRVRPDPARFVAIEDAGFLQEMLAGLFGHRRQRLSNAIKHWTGDTWNPAWPEAIAAAGIDATARPENLTPAQFVSLAKILRSPQHKVMQDAG